MVFDAMMSATQITTILNAALKVAQKAHDTDLAGKIVDAQAQVVDLKDEMLRQREDNRELREEIARLKEAQQIEQELSLRQHEHVYDRKRADGKIDGPYCVRCWDVARRLVRLRLNPNNPESSRYSCEQCLHERIRKV